MDEATTGTIIGTVIIGVFAIAVAYNWYSKKKPSEKAHREIEVDLKDEKQIKPNEKIDLVEKIVIEEKKQTTLRVISGVYETKGRRSTMEDAHYDDDNLAETFPDIFNNPNTPKPTAYYGIYDGHRGTKASEYLEENLHVMIINNKNFAEGDVESALREGFIEADFEMLKPARIPESRFVDGSTAAVALILGHKLYAANCGDAEVILGRFNEETNQVEGLALSKLHKPTDPDEKKRIQSEGGMVLAGRVGGTLAVSRAFGDVDFKTPFEDEDIKLGVLLTAEPFITVTDLIPHRDQFIIVGCDGVWEKLSRENSVSFVASKIDTQDIQITVEELVNHALATGSQDNISAIIVKLHWD